MTIPHIHTQDEDQCGPSTLPTEAFTVPILDWYKNFLNSENNIELKTGKACSIHLTAYILAVVNKHLLTILMVSIFCKNLFSSLFLAPVI